MSTRDTAPCNRCERDMRHAHVRLTWDDPTSPRFTYTLAPVGGDVYASFARARKIAMTVAKQARADLKALIDRLYNDHDSLTVQREPGITDVGTP